MVGAGPVATSLAGGLRLGGVPVLGLWARNGQAARVAGSTSGVAAFSAAPPDLLLEADVVVLAVRDDAIAEVAEKLVGTGLITRKHVLLHCSGASSAETVFSSVKEKVGGVATMHPLRSLPEAQQSMRSLAGTTFGIEGDERGVLEALALVEAVEGSALRLDGNQMVLYHAAAAMASNFLVALLDVAGTVISKAGIEKEKGVAALVSLAQGTLDSVRERGCEGALTGPIQRGDVNTVAKHLEALPPVPLEVYRLLGRQVLALAKQGNPPTDIERLEVAWSELAKLLGSPVNQGTTRVSGRNAL